MWFTPIHRSCLHFRRIVLVRNCIRDLAAVTLVVLAVGFGPRVALAQSDVPNLNDTLDLNACIRLALAHEPTTRAARYQADAARARAGQAFGGLLPRVEASASYSRNHLTPGGDSSSVDI